MQIKQIVAPGDPVCAGFAGDAGEITLSPVLVWGLTENGRVVGMVADADFPGYLMPVAESGEMDNFLGYFTAEDEECGEDCECDCEPSPEEPS